MEQVCVEFHIAKAPSTRIRIFFKIEPFFLRFQNQKKNKMKICIYVRPHVAIRIVFARP